MRGRSIAIGRRGKRNLWGHFVAGTLISVLASVGALALTTGTVSANAAYVPSTTPAESGPPHPT